MKKNILILFITVFAISAQAQNVYNSSGRRVAKKKEKKSGFDRDKLVLGGDFRINFGQSISLGISPIVGYQFVDNFFAGVKLNYSYSRLLVDYNSLPASATTNIFKFNAYSGSVWARYLLWQSVYIHTEFEYFQYQDYFYDASAIVRKTISAPSVLIGVGFRQPISDRVTFNTTLVYDVLNDPNSYYYRFGSGIDLRFGILVGF